MLGDYMKSIFSIKNDLFPLLKLAIPLALTGLVQSAVWFFETAFLARLGQDSLAAGALVSWLFGTMAVVLFGTLSSINILVAHKFGAKDQEGISRVLRDGIILSAILALPAFLLFWNMADIFLLFGQQNSIVALAESYLHPLAWGILPDFVLIVFLEFIIGLGHARTIMFFNLFFVTANILLSYTFIFGKFGAPSLGIAGAGVGMSLSYWISAIVLALYVLSSKKYSSYFYNMFSVGKPSYIYELLKVGLPIGLMYCTEVAFFFALTIAMGYFGSEVLAANQVALQYMGVFMAMIFSIAQAITVRMGHEIGAKNILSAEKAAYSGIFIAAGLMVLVAIIYLFFPEKLISVDFNVELEKNAGITELIKQFFVVGAVFQIFEAIRIALFGALRGLKDTRFTLFVSIVSFWGIALPGGYVLAQYLKFGGVGFWWSMVFGAVTSVLLLLLRFRKMISYL